MTLSERAKRIYCGLLGVKAVAFDDESCIESIESELQAVADEANEELKVKFKHWTEVAAKDAIANNEPLVRQRIQAAVSAQCKVTDLIAEDRDRWADSACRLEEALLKNDLKRKRDPLNCLRCGHGKDQHNEYGYCFGSDPTEIETKCVCTWIKEVEASTLEKAAQVAERRWQCPDSPESCDDVQSGNACHCPQDYGQDISKAIRALKESQLEGHHPENTFTDFIDQEPK